MAEPARKMMTKGQAETQAELKKIEATKKEIENVEHFERQREALLKHSFNAIDRRLPTPRVTEQFAQVAEGVNPAIMHAERTLQTGTLSGKMSTIRGKWQNDLMNKLGEKRWRWIPFVKVVNGFLAKKVFSMVGDAITTHRRASPEEMQESHALLHGIPGETRGLYEIRAEALAIKELIHYKEQIKQQVNNLILEGKPKEAGELVMKFSRTVQKNVKLAEAIEAYIKEWEGKTADIKAFSAGRPDNMTTTKRR